MCGVDDGLQTQNVFYNPIQQFNRDLSVLAIKTFGEDVCHGKRKRHEQQHEKKQHKKAKKRKQDGVAQEADDSGPKFLRKDDGSHVAVSRTDNVTSHAANDGALEAERPDDIADAVPQAAAIQVGEPPIVNGSQLEQQPIGDIDSQSQQRWKPRFRILDALSATGLRALRYASEIPFVTAVVANDRDVNAAKSIKLNAEHNKLTDSITATTGDAIGHMYSVAFPSPHSHGPNHISGKYDVIDLDPYGTAAPFIPAALQALDDGGLLCVTCTDSAVFASCGYSEKTYALYGGLPIKGNHGHEGGLRLILHSIATDAAKFGIAIEPLLSLSIDFYARLFIRIRRSANDVKFLAGKTMQVYECDHGCGAWTTQHFGRHTRQKNNDQNWKFSIAQGPAADRHCEHCGSKTHIAGPMWGGLLHNATFIEKILTDLEHADKEIYQTKSRIEGMLDTALDELSVNPEALDFRNHKSSGIIPQTSAHVIDHHPFFFIPSALCKVVKCSAPGDNLVRGALRHAGYKAARSHCQRGSIKTDAPWSFIWDMKREYVRQKSPIKDGAVKEGQPGWKILQQMRDSEGDENAVEEDSQHAVDGAPDGVTETNGTSKPPEKSTDPKKSKIVFDEKLGKDKPGKRLVRYQMNPRENWGPMTKAKGSA